jgi:hypothetical protein
MTTTLERPPVTPPPSRGGGARALTWTGAIIGGLLLLSGGYSAIDLILVRSGDATTISEQASYAAAPVVELVADGDVSVTTGGDRVEVERTSTTALARARYSVDEDSDRLRVSFRCDWRPGNCQVALDVTVPDGTSVVIHSRDGAVTASALRGPLDVRSGDGDSDISDIDGDVTVRSSDGRTDVRDVSGTVSVQAGDGAVTIDGVSGQVTTRSSDGRTEISDARGDIDARGSDGDVTVYGTGKPVALDISVSDGGQTVEGPVDSSSSTHVTIRVRDGHAAYLRPRG